MTILHNKNSSMTCVNVSFKKQQSKVGQKLWLHGGDMECNSTEDGACNVRLKQREANNGKVIYSVH